MEVTLEQSWKDLLKDEFDKSYFQSLVSFVKKEYSSQRVFPHPKAIFRALDTTPVEQVKVVILGQDPYHKVKGYNADGLSFSVKAGDTIPPSLRNIFKELESDLGYKPPENGDLSEWAKQGVLLLNATLTVRAASPGSHQGKGWEEFTDSVIKKLSDERKNLVFILWGSYARKKGSVIDSSKHAIIQSPHPSPFSADRGFFGSKPFSKANEYLQNHSISPVNWKLS